MESEETEGMESKVQVAARVVDAVLPLLARVETAVTDSQPSQRCATHEIRNHSIEHRAERGCMGWRCAVVAA